MVVLIRRLHQLVPPDADPSHHHRPLPRGQGGRYRPHPSLKVGLSVFMVLLSSIILTLLAGEVKQVSSEKKNILKAGPDVNNCP